MLKQIQSARKHVLDTVSLVAAVKYGETCDASHGTDLWLHAGLDNWKADRVGSYWSLLALHVFLIKKKQIKCKNNQMFALMVHFLDFLIKKVRVKDYT